MNYSSRFVLNFKNFYYLYRSNPNFHPTVAATPAINIEQTPTLYIIAGCNGAGKTTASMTVLPEVLDCREFVNIPETKI